MEKFSVKAQVGKRRYNVTDSNLSTPYPVHKSIGILSLIMDRRNNNTIPLKIKKGVLNTFEGENVSKLIVEDNEGSVTEISLYDENGRPDVIIKGGFVIGIYKNVTSDFKINYKSFLASGTSIKDNCVKFEGVDIMKSEEEKSVLIKHINTINFLSKSCNLVTTDGLKEGMMLFFFSKSQAISFLSPFSFFKTFIEAGHEELEGRLTTKSIELQNLSNNLIQKVSSLEGMLKSRSDEVLSIKGIYENKLSNSEKLISELKNKADESTKEYEDLYDRHFLLKKKFNSVTVWSLIKSWFKK